MLVSGQLSSQWQATSGPVLRGIYGLDAFKGKYYACLGSGEIYTSSSPAFNWQEIYWTNGMTPSCGSDSQYFYISYVDGIIRTQDGLNWQKIDSIMGHVFCVDKNGILVTDVTIIGNDWYTLLYLSRDHGDTWIHKTIKGGYIYYTALRDTTILLGTPEGKMRISRDFGNTWIDTSVNIPGAWGFVGANANEDFFFLASAGDGIYRSSDAFTWEKVFNCPGVDICKNIGIQDSNICVVADTSVGLLFSKNNGTSWKTVTYDFKYHTRDDIYDNYLNLNYTDNNLILSTNGNGLFVLDTIKQSWIPISVGLSDISVHYLLDSDSALFAGCHWDFDMSVSTDTGRSWNALSEIGWSSSDEMDGMAVNSNMVYSVRGIDGENLGISKSTDYGKTWSQIFKFTTYYVYPIFALDSLICGCMPNGIKLSWDDGVTWTDYVPGAPHDTSTPHGPDLERISNSTDVHFTAFGGMGSELYAGTYRGSLFYSADKGHTWDTLSTPAIDSMITAISVTPTTIVIGTYGQGVFISFDHGQTWNQVNNGIQNFYILTLSVAGSALFVSTLSGTAYSSGDDGQHWQDITDGLAGTRINVICAAKGYLYAGTSGRGIWRRPISDAISAVEHQPENEIPFKFSLSQNYPNPFNPTTTIQFGLPKAENVEIRIVNILGQEVATLVHQYLPAGWHSVQWNASGCASGVYICEMRVGNYEFSKKLLLLR